MKKAALLSFLLAFTVSHAQAQPHEPLVNMDWMSYIIVADKLVMPVAYTQEAESSYRSLFSLFFPPDACGAPLPSLTLIAPSDSSLPEKSAVATVKIGGHSFTATATFVHDATEITIPLAFRNVPSLIQAARGGRTILLEIAATANTPKINLTFSLM